jgi:hypothetical protein
MYFVEALNWNMTLAYKDYPGTIFVIYVEFPNLYPFMVEEQRLIFTHVTQIFLSIYLAKSAFVSWIWRLIKESVA